MTVPEPPQGTHCVVDDCARAATTYVDVNGGPAFAGENAVPMCDQHAAHWRAG